MSLRECLETTISNATALVADLKAIPPACPCTSAEAHLSEGCCCERSLDLLRPDADRVCTGCTSLLERLSRSIRTLQAELSSELVAATPRQLVQEGGGGLLRLESAVRRLALATSEAHLRLRAFRKSCGYADLIRLKDCSADIAGRVADLKADLAGPVRSAGRTDDR